MSQSLSQLCIHIIFSTKNRKPFLKNEYVRQKLYDYLTLLCDQHNCPAIIVGGIEDHIHLLINLNKRYSLSTIIEIIKKDSSKWIKTLTEFDEGLKDFYWQSGYGAFSVSKTNIENVKSYIKNQQAHHKKFNFKDELRKILNASGVHYNDDYLWR